MVQETIIRKNVNDMAKRDDNFVELFNLEFRALTDIGNKFRIRHHETNKVDIADIRYCDYFLIDVYHSSI